MAGDRDTHGTHEFFRHGGSIGCRLTPGRVHKGKRMSGLMGDVKCTASDLVVVKVLDDKDVVLVKGAIPGPANGLVLIKGSVKDVKKYIVPRADQRGRVEEPDEGLQEGRAPAPRSRQEVAAPEPEQSTRRRCRSSAIRAHRHDAFFKKARGAGFAARSVYKLEEIDRRLRLLRAGRSGARPRLPARLVAAVRAVKIVGPARRGGRASIATRCPSRSRARASSCGDIFTTPDAELLGPLAAFDVVLSDMAPDTTGVRATDQARSAALFEEALARAERLLAPGGAFVGKLFQGPDVEAIRKRLAARFSEVRTLKPESSRAAEHRDLPGGQGLRLTTRGAFVTAQRIGPAVRSRPTTAGATTAATFPGSTASAGTDRRGPLADRDAALAPARRERRARRRAATRRKPTRRRAEPATAEQPRQPASPAGGAAQARRGSAGSGSAAGCGVTSAG